MWSQEQQEREGASNAAYANANRMPFGPQGHGHGTHRGAAEVTTDEKDVCSGK